MTPERRKALEALRDDCKAAAEMAGELTEAKIFEAHVQRLDTILAMPDEPVGLPWVSVKERLPKPGENALWAYDDFSGMREHCGPEPSPSASWYSHWLPLSAIPLPGQSPERERPEQTEAFRAVVLDDLLSGGERTISPGGGMEQRPDWRPYLQESSAGLREALVRILGWRENDLPEGDRAARAIEFMEDTARSALRAEEQSHE